MASFSPAYSFRLPVFVRYHAGLFARIWLVVLLVLLTVEAIFLSDTIVSLILPELLALDATFLTIFSVILYSIPGGVFIALPLAILIGVYLVLLRLREDQELMVTAGLGHDLKPLLLIALLAGLSGAMLSFLVSGFLEPLARYQFKRTLVVAAQQAILDGKLVAGRFYSVGDATLHASAGELSDVARNVFIHTRKDDGAHRVMLVRETQNPKVTQDGKIGLVFVDANVYEFADTAGTDKENPQPATHFLFSNFYFELPHIELPKPRNREGWWEATTPELLSMPEKSADTIRSIGERFMRAVLCLLAPFLALAALSMTSRSTLLLALPGAAGGILGLSFFNSGMTAQLSQFGLGATALGVAALGVLILAASIVVVRARRNNIMRSAGLTF